MRKDDDLTHDRWLEDPTSGSVYLGGEEVSNLPPYRRDVNTVFQSYADQPDVKHHGPWLGIYTAFAIGVVYVIIVVLRERGLLGDPGKYASREI